MCSTQRDVLISLNDVNVVDKIIHIVLLLRCGELGHVWAESHAAFNLAHYTAEVL